MSDEEARNGPLKVTVARRKVVRDSTNKLYFVMERFTHDGKDLGWRSNGKGYKHSTSCYAHLGRIVSAEGKLL